MSYVRIPIRYFGFPSTEILWRNEAIISRSASMNMNHKKGFKRTRNQQLPIIINQHSWTTS